MLNSLNSELNSPRTTLNSSFHNLISPLSTNRSKLLNKSTKFFLNLKKHILFYDKILLINQNL